ncbi:hypothetical protein [Aetokthonos hydrillicola]|uniref:hypothetical protein n=1 Tax=Aetokthonos hydrillicola TaxID=1550245 RepID=UPI0030D876F8
MIRSVVLKPRSKAWKIPEIYLYRAGAISVGLGAIDRVNKKYPIKLWAICQTVVIFCNMDGQM